MLDLSAFLANPLGIIPDMGRYAVYVWSSYAVTALVLGILFGTSLASWHRAVSLLKKAEQHGASTTQKGTRGSNTGSPDLSLSKPISSDQAEGNIASPSMKTPEHV